MYLYIKKHLKHKQSKLALGQKKKTVKASLALLIGGPLSLTLASTYWVYLFCQIINCGKKMSFFGPVHKFPPGN